jgi:hypothetical protein
VGYCFLLRFSSSSPLLPFSQSSSSSILISSSQLPHSRALSLSVSLAPALSFTPAPPSASPPSPLPQPTLNSREQPRSYKRSHFRSHSHPTPLARTCALAFTSTPTCAPILACVRTLTLAVAFIDPALVAASRVKDNSLVDRMFRKLFDGDHSGFWKSGEAPLGGSIGQAVSGSTFEAQLCPEVKHGDLVGRNHVLEGYGL